MSYLLSMEMKGAVWLSFCLSRPKNLLKEYGTEKVGVMMEEVIAREVAGENCLYDWKAGKAK